MVPPPPMPRWLRGGRGRVVDSVRWVAVRCEKVGVGWLVLGEVVGVHGEDVGAGEESFDVEVGVGLEAEAQFGEGGMLARVGRSQTSWVWVRLLWLA